MTGALTVWWNQRLVGHLTQDRHGELGFVYAAAWLNDPHVPPVSASLPKRVEPFSRRECRPFFGGLLPEHGQRERAARALGVSVANDYALLARLGGDVAGALQLLPHGQTPKASRGPLRPRVLTDAEVVNVLDSLPARPLLAGESGLRLSLAGAQSKVPVVVVGNAIALPRNGQPTTHIVKPPIERFPTTTENEAFVMRLAWTVGLDVAQVEPRVVHGRKFLLVRRYDRKLTKGRVDRVHQEDFCQALGVPPETKYASEGGPTFRDCFELVRRVSARPAVDVLRLLDACIMNLIVGNADAHGKNFSILYGDGGARLAPLYDLLSTVAYKGLSPKLAMKIGKQATLGSIKLANWALFSKDAGLGLPLVRRRVGELADLAGKRANDVAAQLFLPGLDEVALVQFAAMVVNRAERCALTVAAR